MKNPIRICDTLIDSTSVARVVEEGLYLYVYMAGDTDAATIVIAGGTIDKYEAALRRSPCAQSANRWMAVALGSWLVMLLLFFTGCESVNQSAPVKGGGYQVAAPLADYSEVLSQGDNAKTPSTLQRIVRSWDADGNLVAQSTTNVTLGTSRDPIITIPPADDWGKWGVAILGAIAFIAGLILLFKGWPKIGGAAAVGGVISMIIALTVGQWGWAYALAVLAAAGVGAWVLYSGYKSGLKETSVRDLNLINPDTSDSPKATSLNF